MYPDGLAGVKPQLRMADLAVRVNFLTQLVSEGKLKAWPWFIDADGRSFLLGAPGLPGASGLVILT